MGLLEILLRGNNRPQEDITEITATVEAVNLEPHDTVYGFGLGLPWFRAREIAFRGDNGVILSFIQNPPYRGSFARGEKYRISYRQSETGGQLVSYQRVKE